MTMQIGLILIAIGQFILLSVILNRLRHLQMHLSVVGSKVFDLERRLGMNEDEP